MSQIIRTLRPVSAFRSFRPNVRRNFMTVPGTEPQSLTATRILPYNSDSLYKLIADVDNYSKFVPYCVDSKVTEWSAEDKDGKRWPSKADLKVGWGGFEETFSSRQFCVPGSIVEALGGDAVTSISKSEIAHHRSTFDSPTTANNIFQSLSTRWTLRPFHYKPPTGQPQTDKTEHAAKERTEVHLTIDFQFANPIYAAFSKAVAPKVATVMIEAFEVRARKLLDVSGAAVLEKDGKFGAGKQLNV